MYRFIVAGFLVMLIHNAQADVYPVDDLVTDPKPALFSICYHGTCEETTEVRLRLEQWQQVRNVFKDHKTGADEREQIRQAVALMEDIVGKLTGTDRDKAGTFAHLGEEGQLDCVDESINTSFYMQMMANDGLIRTHSVEDRAHRGFFLNRWPHSTAVIRDKQSGKVFAVDSWFMDNGQPPYIIPLQEWDDGWKPADFKEWSR